MLPVPHGDSSISIVGLDPGSDNLGVCIMRVDVFTQKIFSTEAFTLRGSQLPGSEWMASLHNDRFKRIQSLKTNLILLFRQIQPLCIAVESPFFNHFRPQAYGVLMEVLNAIREAVCEYDVWQAPYLIDPSSVKNAVGCLGNANKDAVRAAILNLQDIGAMQNLQTLDEHSLDAIAVAYCRVKRLFIGE